MNLFFDTSALVKFFHEEEGTDIVTDLILEQNKDWSFVVADDNLCKVAEVIGFTTINPLKRP